MRTGCFILTAIVAGFVSAGCKPIGNGQSNANEAPVPDGEVVLLRRSNEVAAVVLRNQRVTPEGMDFSWYYRSDGKGTFSTNDPAVSTGMVTNASQIAFTTFSVGWSGNRAGKGWVYFSSGPTELRTPADFVMCVTTETNLAMVDAVARKWKYRGRPGVNVRALIESQIK